ncbi:amidohydrolase family protein [Hyphobacterium sp.]|uniref:amidohydrolase family protein n=1 Tax=Hyphobacterium sp. TaxID=2004662 RepID=UPI00374A6DC2
MFTILALALAGLQPGAVCDLRIENGQVWNGEAFEAANLEVSGAMIVDLPEAECTTVIDAAGQFLSPAFGEGHSHNVETAWLFPSVNQRHLEEGVYYVQNMNARASTVAQLGAQPDQPDTIDVSFAMGGLTSFRGHPDLSYTLFLSSLLYGGADRSALVEDAFHTVESVDDIGPALDRLEADGADFVKVFLENSERFAANNAWLADDANWEMLVNQIQSGELEGDALVDRLTEIGTGLNPDLVAPIVEAAHARGLRVMAHVGSAFDFEVAVRAGVDAMAHLPGPYLAEGERIEDVELSPEIIAEAAERGLTVIATANVRPEFVRPETADTVYDMQRQNIRALLEGGVPVLIGTDRWNIMSFEEVRFLVEQNMMSPQEAYEAWIATGRQIFPDRAIGCLQASCEADILVFASNPGVSLDGLQSLQMRIKQGVVLGDT